MLSILGLDIGLIRFLSDEDKKSDLINSCFSVSTLLALIFSILFIAIVNNFSAELELLFRDYTYVLTFISFSVLMVIITLQSNVFLGFREGKLIFLQNIIGSLRLIIVVLLVSFGILGIIVSYGISILFAFVIGNFLLRGIISDYRLYPKIKLNLMRRLTSFALGNYIATVAENLPNYLLPLIVLNLLGPESSAYFAIAWAFSVLLMSVPKSAALSLFAEGSYAPSSVSKNVLRTVKFILVAMVPAFIIIILFGNYLLLMFGEQYSQNAYLVLVLFVLGGFPYSFNSIFVSVKRIEKNIKTIFIVYATIAIVYLSTSYLLINEYGLVGVGLGWLFTHSLVALAILLHKYIT